MEAPLYAGIVVDLRVSQVDKLYHYLVPAELRPLLQIGHRVLVGFGARRLEGYVLELTAEPQVEPQRIREILRLLDPAPLILPSLVELALWMRSHYAGLLSEALQFMLPVGFRYGKERVRPKTRWQVTLLQPSPILRPNAVVQKRVVELLGRSGQMWAAELISRAKASYSTLQALEKQGIIRLEQARQERQVDLDPLPAQTLCLTAEQTAALAKIRAGGAEDLRPVLIHGVTGSGKTELYLRLIADVVAQGRQAIVLVPEIALTPQTVSRFASRFGRRISVLHSALSEGERFDQWQRAFRGEVDLVIGARSAVFAPTPNLGLIVLDEEHEGSYKQEEGSIRYQTREVAIKRCELAGARVLLGSATPALESYHRALQGEYRLVELTERVERRPLPQVQVVDMRQEFEQGNRSMFSAALRQALLDLEGSEHQAIILLNRRGFANFVLCRECGHVLQCPNCQVSLTYHQAAASLVCHYCQHRQPLPERCPNCASAYLRQFGVGTEQVEEALGKEFPALKTLRLDADTTRRKGAHAAILGQFGQGRAQVLLGTQMVAKGLDFPKVTLVGVLSADLTLNFPDLRSAERTFQLLTQVAGRSGRGAVPGQVIIQAYEPGHFAISCAQKHDYLSFFRGEISFRRNMGYPPFRQLTRILCSGPRSETEEAAGEILTYLVARGIPRRDILGPAPAPIGRIKGAYRWQLLLKSDRSPAELLRGLPAAPAQVLVSIDIDPLLLL